MAAPVLLVYAICSPPRQRLRLDGIAGEPLAIVRAAGLAAVAGELARAPRVSVAALRRYDAVLRELAMELPAVLPARFGTCMGSAEEIAFVLKAREASLRTALRAVRGRVQMTLRSVRADAGPDALPAAEVDRGSGRAYLRSLAAQASRSRDVPTLAPVIAAVGRWVRAERVERSGQVASVYHLIPRSAVESYARAAHRAAEDSGIPVVVTGPFPAYAFGAS